MSFTSSANCRQLSRRKKVSRLLRSGVARSRALLPGRTAAGGSLQLRVVSAEQDVPCGCDVRGLSRASLSDTTPARQCAVRAVSFPGKVRCAVAYTARYNLDVRKMCCVSHACYDVHAGRSASGSQYSTSPP